MFCTHCGSRNEDTYAFCTNCGKPLTRVDGGFGAPQAAHPAARGVAQPSAQFDAGKDPTGPVTTVVSPVLDYAASPGLAAGATGAPSPSRVSLVRSSNGKSYEVETFPATIGKGSAATVRIDGNNTISRSHVRLSLVGAGLVLEELGATNNTYVNGRRLVVGETVALSAGDELQLADEKFTVVIS